MHSLNSTPIEAKLFSKPKAHGADCFILKDFQNAACVSCGNFENISYGYVGLHSMLDKPVSEVSIASVLWTLGLSSRTYGGGGTFCTHIFCDVPLSDGTISVGAMLPI